jgi:parallel beta-helix repeat protein
VRVKPCLVVLTAFAVLGLAVPAEGARVAAAKTARPQSNAEHYRAALARLVGDQSRSLARAADAPADATTPPDPSASVPLVVDGPPAVECPDAQFTSIQAAVAAAPSGGTIKVCPGLYTETVTVPKQKPLTFRALRDWPTAAPCPTDLATDPQRYAIVAPPSPSPSPSPGSDDGFRLSEDGSAIDGFVIRGFSRGIVTDPGFSGYAIRNVILQDDTIGISFASSGAQESTIERSCMRATSVGLESFSLRRARVDRNDLRQNGFGVALVDVADVRVTRNDVSDTSQAGILATLGTNVSVRGNRVTRSGSAIVYGNTDGDIRFNRIQQAAETAIGLFSGHDVQVGFNLIRESGVGVQLLEAHGNSLRDNLIESSGSDGILMDASDANLIEGNLSRANGADGIHVASQSSANTIRQNKLRGNAGLDCHDDTVGAGTAGTANFWIKNRGESDVPRGLCRGRGPATVATRASAR